MESARYRDSSTWKWMILHLFAGKEVMDDSQRLMVWRVYFFLLFLCVCMLIQYVWDCVCIIGTDMKCDIRKCSLCHRDIHFKPIFLQIDWGNWLYLCLQVCVRECVCVFVIISRVKTCLLDWLTDTFSCSPSHYWSAHIISMPVF